MSVFTTFIAPIYDNLIHHIIMTLHTFHVIHYHTHLTYMYPTHERFKHVHSNDVSEMFFNHTHRTYRYPTHERFKYVHSNDGFEIFFNHLHCAIQCKLCLDCYVLQLHLVRITFMFQTSMFKCHYSLKSPCRVVLLLRLKFNSNENIK